MDKQKLKELEEDGYTIIKNVFSNEEIADFREAAKEYFDNNPYLHWGNNDTEIKSKILPGWCDNEFLNKVKGKKLSQIASLPSDKRIVSLLNYFFKGEEWIFMNESDLHENVNTPEWHSDSINQVTDFEKEKILKTCILLQDHLDDETGLWMKPKTHLRTDWRDRGRECNDLPSKSINSEAGDIVLFNQYAIHKGQDGNPSYYERYKRNRYFMTLSFGINNEYTKTQMEHTRARQLDQQKDMT